MRRPTSLRLLLCASVSAVTAAGGLLLAPAASAESRQGPPLPAHLADIPSNAPSVHATVPWLGRKL